MINLYKRKVSNYLLLPIAAIFYLLSTIRKVFYKLGICKVNSFSVPIIIVGNITVGGSGKTPIVIALTQALQNKGKTIGVVSRGYGSVDKKHSLLVTKHTSASQTGDEPLLIFNTTGANVMVNKNRPQAVRDLIKKHDVDIIISDDGMQHYALGRDIEIAVIDGERRFGNGFLLPAGPLREPKSRLKTVDFIINNGASKEGEITTTLVPVKFINLVTGVSVKLDYFNNTACNVTAGIGNPQRFFDGLSALGVIVTQYVFADHYRYTKSNFNFNNDNPIIMTAKDCVKCMEFANKNMWYLHAEVNLDNEFITAITTKLCLKKNY